MWAERASGAVPIRIFIVEAAHASQPPTTKDVAQRAPWILIGSRFCTLTLTRKKETGPGSQKFEKFSGNPGGEKGMAEREWGERDAGSDRPDSMFGEAVCGTGAVSPASSFVSQSAPSLNFPFSITHTKPL